MRKRALLSLVIGGLLLNTAASRTIQLPSRQTTSVATVTIPFELANKHIIIKVRVNNSRPLSFVLDTGDKFAIIDLERARELKLDLHGRVRMGGAGSQLSIGAFVRGASFTIPGFDGFAQPMVLALPINNLAGRLGQDFDGIIGSDFISEFIVEVDYQARVLRLHDKRTFTYTGPGESVPIKLNSHGHPIVEAEVTPIGSPPITGKFVLDIGSGLALALYSPFVAERQLLNPNLKTIKALSGAGAGGETTGRFGRVSELKIGKFRIKNLITFFSEDKAGAFASSSLVGNIGAQITSRFRILLDYSQERVIFEPNATFALGFDRAFGGVTLEADGPDYKTFRVMAVLENSPASEAGLQKNDVITEVDGKPSAQLTLSKLNEMFEKPVSYKLTVRRGEQVLPVKLTPRRLV